MPVNRGDQHGFNFLELIHWVKSTVNGGGDKHGFNIELKVYGFNFSYSLLTGEISMVLSWPVMFRKLAWF